MIINISPTENRVVSVMYSQYSICSMINTIMSGYILVGLQFFLEIYIFVEKMGEINFYKWPQLGTRHGGNTA